MNYDTSDGWPNWLIAVALLLAVPLTWYWGWVISVLWGWFIEPLFGVSVTVLEAIGLAIIAGMFGSGKPDSDDALEAVVRSVLNPTIAVVLGAIVYGLML